jgi:tetratricopeptide (TPR) repeat protein
MFLAIGAYVAFVRRRNAASYLRMLVWYALALLAKPMPVTLPFLLLLFDYWPLGREGEAGPRGFVRALPRLAFEKLPLFAFSAASCVITYIVQGKSGAVRGFEAVPFTLRIQNVLVSYVGYLGKFFAPVNLVPHYPLVDHSAVRVALCAVLLAAVTLCALVFVRTRPYLFTGWFWYVGTLVPAIGIVQVGNQALADRYTYAPMIGIAVALIWLAGESTASRRTLQRAGVAAFMVAVVAFAAATFHQTHYWKDTKTLFTRTIEVSPNSSVAHKIMGIAYAKENNLDAALPYFQRAMELNSFDRDSAFNLGTALLALDRVDESIPLLIAAVSAYEKPADAYTNLGRALMQKNLPVDARSQLLKALEINPNQNDALLNLGIVEGMLGNVQQAVDTLTEVVRRAPDNPDARYNYGVALLKAGKRNEAATQFDEALRLRPDFPDAAANLQQARASG